MDSPWLSLIAFVIMLLAVGLGGLIRRRWPEHHSNRETIELVQTTVMMLATFAAIVLGLLITSSKSDFDGIESNLRALSSSIVELDYSLEGLGAAAVPARQQLARYLGAAIASTWEDQQPPGGDFYPRLPRSSSSRTSQNSPVLGRILEGVSSSIQQMPVSSGAEARAQTNSLRLMDLVLTERWQLISSAEGSLSAPFFVVLVFWLAVIFLCFGLSAPFNHLSFLVTALSALALASALFVIIDLYTPFTGIFTVSSTPARQALASMLAQPDGTPPPSSNSP
jgi:hypothetical protein